jgi:hypothetical protein
MAALNGQRTFLQLQNAVGAVMLEQTALSASTYPTLDSVKAKINEVYRDVTAKHPWLMTLAQTTFNTVTNTQLVTLADGVERVIGMQLQGTNQPIRYMPFNKLMLAYPGGWNQITPGQPIYWTDAPQAANNAQQIYLFPAPNGVMTVTVQYHLRLTPLSQDTDYSIIPPEFEDILIYGTLADMLAQLSDSRRDYYQARYDQLQSKLWMRDQTNLDGMGSQMDYSAGQVQGWPGIIQPYIG